MPFDLWIQDFDWKITDGENIEIKMDILHHVNIINVEEDWIKPDFNNKIYVNDMVLMLGAPLVEDWHYIKADEMRSELGIR